MLPGYDKQHTTDTQVSQQNIHPDIRREGVEEGEDPRVGPVGLAVQYTYTQRHERLGEVDNLFTYICDGERSHCQISSLSTAKNKEREIGHKSWAQEAIKGNQIMETGYEQARESVPRHLARNLKPSFSLYPSTILPLLNSPFSLYNLNQSIHLFSLPTFSFCYDGCEL